ncbi:MAG: hypothetical protein ACM3SU_16235 [Acidobacteriota bacterium]
MIDPRSTLGAGLEDLIRREETAGAIEIVGEQAPSFVEAFAGSFETVLAKRLRSLKDDGQCLSKRFRHRKQAFKARGQVHESGNVCCSPGRPNRPYAQGRQRLRPRSAPPEIPYDGELVLALARSAVGQLQAAGILLEVTGRE